MISVILVKWARVHDFHLSFFQTVGEWWNYIVVTKLIKNFKSLYGFGAWCLNIRDVLMDCEQCFKIYNKVVFVRPKSIKLGQMTNLNMIFHVVVSVYWSVKIWNLPQFPVQFQNGYYATRTKLKPFYRFGVIRRSHHQSKWQH